MNVVKNIFIIDHIMINYHNFSLQI